MPRDSEVATLSSPVTNADHAQGRVDATVTLVEYGDYECPHCGLAYPIVKAVQGDLGPRLRFVFRNFPLKELHPHAFHAAEAAEAAGSQGRFWDMHDLLFEHQRELADDKLGEYAGALLLDRSRFARELTSHVHAARVRTDFAGGVRSGVNGTPTFFINGVRYDGPWDVDSLTARLERVASGLAAPR
jgi:protein-disulfide isomerase